MSIYSYDNKIVAEQIAPPTLRQSKFLAWLYVITKPVQSLWSLIFNGYKNGTTVYYDLDNTFFLPPFGYVFSVGEVIKDSKSIYICTKSSTYAGFANLADFDKLQDNFLGVSERIKYNSQKILFDLFNTLGTNATNKENTIRQFADKYNLAGTTYNVITY